MGYKFSDWYEMVQELRRELVQKDIEIEELRDENYGWFSLNDLLEVENYRLKKELAISNRLLDIWIPDNIFPEEYHTQEQFQDIIDKYGKIEVWGEVFPREENKEESEDEE